MKQEFFKLGKSFRAAWHGLCSVVRRERNFRIHLVVSAYVLAFAWLGRVSGAQLALLFACIGLVLALELVNTAVETLCDRVTTKQDEQIGKVKDFAAAAVLIAALMAAAAGLAIFLSKPVPRSAKAFAQFKKFLLHGGYLLARGIPQAVKISS